MRIAYIRAMKLSDTAPGRYRIAIACSIALHLCALAVALLLPWPSLPRAPVERPVVVSIVMRPRPKPPAPPAPAIGPVPAARPEPAPHARAQAAAIHLVRQAVPAKTVVHTAAVRHDLSRAVRTPAAPSEIAVVAGASAAPVAVAEPAVAVAHPSGSGSSAAASAGGGGGGNPGLFSATYPPVPAQLGALEAIRAALPARMRLRITVDENGRAADVDWLSPQPDAALAGAIRAKLMALPYIPAECDGLPCTGIISLAT
jgi:hypothetical protein